MSQAESTMLAEEIKTEAKKLDQVASWPRRLGYFSGGIGYPGRRKNDERETLKPIAVSGSSPPLVARYHVTIQAGRRTLVAT